MYTWCSILLLWLFAGVSQKEANSTTGFIKAGNYRVYYEQHGNGNAVLLLHAGLQNHTMWNKQVAALSKKYKVVTIDLPYHGNTTGHDTSLLASDVVKTVLDSLHITKTSIAGLSMGASVTQDFIIAYPERVNKAILISSGINGYENRFPIDSTSMLWYDRFVAALAAKDTVQAARVFTRTWSEGIDAKEGSFTKDASQYVYATTLATLRQHQMKSWPHLKNNPLAMERLSQIQLPVLIIHGEKDIPIVEKTSTYLEQTIKGAERVQIDDVAHMLNLEKSDEVNTLLMNFLQQQPY